MDNSTLDVLTPIKGDERMDENDAVMRTIIDMKKGDLNAIPGGLWCKNLPEGEDRKTYLRYAAIALKLSQKDFLNIQLGGYSVVPSALGYLVQIPG